MGIPLQLFFHRRAHDKESSSGFGPTRVTLYGNKIYVTLMHVKTHFRRLNIYVPLS